MSIWLNLRLVNCTDSLFACIIYVYCSEYICGSIFVAGRNCEYFLLTKDNTCGLVFHNVVISVLFDYMLSGVWHLICVTCSGWDYGCDAVCMIILWCGISLNKRTGGLGTKASVDWVNQLINWGLCTKASRGWLDRWISRKFRY
jgi:hypothetical protein